MAGNDTLEGDAGDDLMLGGDGNDKPYAGDGDDSLVGDAGADLMHGGAGNDIFYCSPGDGNDTIDGGTVDSASDNPSNYLTLVHPDGEEPFTIEEIIAGLAVSGPAGAEAGNAAWTIVYPRGAAPLAGIHRHATLRHADHQGRDNQLLKYPHDTPALMAEAGADHPGPRHLAGPVSSRSGRHW